MLLAPGASSHALSAPSQKPGPRQPPIDENVLSENCGYELVDGQVYELSPAEEEHGTEHFQLPAVLGVHLAPEYKGAVDMLTRPGVGSNFAPDVSIFPRARDPETGGRHVEDIVFEVIDTESRSHVTDKTRKLIARGVRRAFLIDVNRRNVREWSRAADDWTLLGDDAQIVDRCFQSPVPVRALVDEGLIEDVLAKALLARNNPVFTQREQRAEQRGEQRGEHNARRHVLRVMLQARGVALDEAQLRRIDGCDDTATLDGWILRAATATTATEVFA